ncbi:uncharacterized protein LOC111612729 [Centruroides sculpturatus]|uniref:uncharacterized protein LOC111612729 n=1 Tax=Centruroides sculpturatus TaxID=218467 RepID=UPI000C6E1582|nr:uncharacterized protein LOC111612729 [Centruroides sculpturatus]
MTSYSQIMLAYSLHSLTLLLICLMTSTLILNSERTVNGMHRVSYSKIGNAENPSLNLYRRWNFIHQDIKTKRALSFLAYWKSPSENTFVQPVASDVNSRPVGLPFRWG